MERRSFVSGLLGFLGLSAVAVAKSEASSEPLEKFQGNTKSLDASLANGNRRLLKVDENLLLDPTTIVAVDRYQPDCATSDCRQLVYLSSGQIIDVPDQSGENLIHYLKSKYE